MQVAVRMVQANAGACNEGSDGEEAAANAARRVYAASGFASDPKAATSAVRRACMARGGVRMVKAHAGARDEGANGNEVMASAVRRAYAASGGTDDPKAMTPAAKRARTAQAAVRTEANGSNDGARYKGSGHDEADASAALRAYASAVSDSDKAAAVATRRTSLAAIDNGEIARTGCHHPTTTTTVADTAIVDNDKVTN